MYHSSWLRVSKKDPCRVCEKADWCTYTEAGAACCMRVESLKPLKNGGWLHKSNERTAPVYYQKRTQAPTIESAPDFDNLCKNWSQETSAGQIARLASDLDVCPMALVNLGCAWARPYKAWAFPMKDPMGKIIGIRLRAWNGQKWAVKGSRAGLFIPGVLPSNENVLMVVEGPTDCAAALPLGYAAIGRPSCLGCEDEVKKFMAHRRFSRALIVTDNDTPGLRGSNKLQLHLNVRSCVWAPPAKDLRQFLSAGGNRQVVDSLLKDIVWSAPK